MKIAHISDLHFATPPVREALRLFRKGVNEHIERLLPEASLDIHLHDDDVVESLRTRLQASDPDVLVISGDLTTFGDRESFDAFGNWCQSLIARAGGGKRKIIVVPGNHDALKDQFSHLKDRAINDLGWKYGLVWRFKIAPILAPVDHLLSALDRDKAKGDPADPLVEFNTFLSNADWISRDPVLVNGDSQGTWGVRIVPFSTVSQDPLWMNRGEQRKRDWKKLQDQLGEKEPQRTNVTIVVAHHNPVAAPASSDAAVVEAYNSMAGSGRFLKALQDQGVDLLLHGHHHEHTLLKFDFDHRAAGHAFALGSECSSDKRSGGFNQLVVVDPNHVELTRFRYTTEKGFTEAGRETLHLERNRPTGTKTLSARYELKGYVYPSVESADEEALAPLKSEAAGLVYMSGRHFRSVRDEQFKDLRTVLRQGGRVRVLLVDPALVTRLAETEGANAAYGDLWGTSETLKIWAVEAQGSLEDFTDLVNSLQSDERKRINVRLSHTLPPFGSYVRDPDRAWGKMSVKLLPIGGIGSLSSAVLRLNRRSDLALYDYYIKHLRFLFLRAKHLLGDWSDDADLRAGMNQGLLDWIDKR